MSIMNKDELFYKFVSGELSVEEEKHALRLIAEDSELLSQLKFELRLHEAFTENSIEWESAAVPEGFSKAVMQEIYRKEKQTSVSLSEKVEAWFKRMKALGTLQWRPVYSFALGIVLTLVVVYPWINWNTQEYNKQLVTMTEQNNSVQEVSSTEEEVMLRFVYIDEEANSVSVAGDFNNWEPIELTERTVNGQTVWTGLVSLSRGEHNYMFIRDGKWVSDPLATVQRDDGFGNKNAVVYL
jgi:hypothetical protein